jgi:hypothetical protein
MKLPAIPNPGATIWLGVFLLLTNVANAVYSAHGLEPSAAFLFLFYFGAAWSVAYWIRADSLRLGVRGSVDRGWFIFAAWPVALPYHLLSTRRWRGLLTLIGLLGLFAVTYLISLVVFFGLRQASGR